jgi:tRNA G18 (ribose-2'-O)-methylase SpoU
MRSIILIAHNLRSAHNVGSLLRTADGLGVDKVYLTGYTPYPLADNDERLPHLAIKLDKQINKTALGAEKMITWEHDDDILGLLAKLRSNNYQIAALEQASKSISLPKFKAPDKIALIVGREVEGLEPEVLAAADAVLEIPIFGQKESFNVAAAAAMALFHVRFLAKQ